LEKKRNGKREGGTKRGGALNSRRKEIKRGKILSWKSPLLRRRKRALDGRRDKGKEGRDDSAAAPSTGQREKKEGGEKKTFSIAR